MYIYVILLVYICDGNVFVMSPSIAVVAAKSWLFLGCSPRSGGCQILAGSEMQPENGQVTVGALHIGHGR